MPKCGRSVITPEGKGKVVRQNILEEMVVVDLGDGKEVEISVHELQRKDKNQKPATLDQK